MIYNVTKHFKEKKKEKRKQVIRKLVIDDYIYSNMPKWNSRSNVREVENPTTLQISYK